MKFATQLASILLVFAVSNSCSLVLDFEELDGLPCGCLPEFVCLVASNGCVPRHSVELFKSCTLDAVDPDALWPRASAEAPMGARCLDRDLRDPFRGDARERAHEAPRHRRHGGLGVRRGAAPRSS